MREKLPIMVLIATKNEEVNIGKCLDSLKPAQRVVVIDSQSQDRTAEIAKSKGAEVVQFVYQGGYPKKRQWALENLKIDTDWVMLLDADEIVPEELWQEVKENIGSNNVDAYLVRKGFHFLGKAFRFGGFSHPAVILFRKGKGKFEWLIDDPKDGFDMEVHERVIINGKIGILKTPLVHQDFKGLEAYLERHNKYSSWEARVRYSYLLTKKWGQNPIPARLFGNSQERRRFIKSIVIRLPFEPWFWFVYHYFLKLGFLEGRPGLIASLIRANYISQVKSKIYELHLKEKGEITNKR